MSMPLTIGGGNSIGGAAVSTTAAAPSFAGVQHVASGLDRFAQNREEANAHQSNLRAIEVEGEINRRWDAELADLDPLAEDYDTQVDAALQEAYAAGMGEAGISHQGTLESLQVSLNKQMNHARLVAQGTRRQALQERGVQTFTDEKDALVAQVTDDPDGFDAYTERLGSIAARIGGAVDPATRQELLRKAGDDLIEAKVEGLALAGRYDEATGFLDDAKGELGLEAHKQMARRVREIRNNHENDFNAATDTRVADLHIAVVDAASSQDLRALRTEVEDMAELGLFDNREQTRVALVKAIESKQSALAQDGRDLALALGKYGARGDLDSQKEADLVHGALMARAGDLTPAQQSAFDTAYAAKTGFLPTNRVRDQRNAERAEDPELLAQAAQFDMQSRATAPEVETGAGARTELTQGFYQVGVPWDQAAQLVIDRAPDKATVAERDEQFKDEFGDTNWREWLQDQGISPARGILSPLTSTAAIPPELATEAGKAVKMFYRMSGDGNAAQAAARAHLDKTFGVSEVGGPSRLMRYPPERYLRVGGDAELQTQVMEAVTATALANVGVKLPERPTDITREEWRAGAKIPTASNYKTHELASDDRTRRDIEAGMLPSYEVRVRSKFGTLMTPVPIDMPDGRRINLRVQVPPQDETMKMPMVQAAVADAQARAKRNKAIVGAAAAMGREFTRMHTSAGRITLPDFLVPDLGAHPYAGWMHRQRAARLAKGE